MTRGYASNILQNILARGDACVNRYGFTSNGDCLLACVNVYNCIF